MVSQISSIYFQSYQMAVELAKIAQKCYHHEKGDDSATFIGAAYWDNLKKGLLSGEMLQFDLCRMENEYLRKNTRELEVSKNISLKALDPVQLDNLRYSGSCTFIVPELLFDLDHPGHYNRRIKSLSVSIPCVVGPYSGVNCTLRLINSWTRKEPSSASDDLKLDPSNSEDKIALSSGQNDSGLFEMNHNDERYLPFELRGTVSEWELEFPSKLEQFDRSTISDVILHMRYTAMMDVNLKGGVNDAISATYKSISDLTNFTEIALRLDIRREFPDLWHKFIETQEEDGNHKLELQLTKALFPYLLRPVCIDMTHLSLFCEMKENGNTIKLSSPAFSGNITWTEVEAAQQGKNYFMSIKQKLGTSMEISNTPVELVINSENSDFKELILVLHYGVG